MLGATIKQPAHEICATIARGAMQWCASSRVGKHTSDPFTVATLICKLGCSTNGNPHRCCRLCALIEVDPITTMPQLVERL
jgi:hypothetical protein